MIKNRTVSWTAEFWLVAQAAWDLGLASQGSEGAGANDPRLAEIVRRLVQSCEPERIYLFGSRARGEGGPDSDYDLLILVGNDAPPERRRGALGYRALRGTGIATDVVVWTEEDFTRRLHIPASLPATVVREGRDVPYRICLAIPLSRGSSGPIPRGGRLRTWDRA